MFNEIDGDFDEVVIKTFKVGLPSEHGLRKNSISSFKKLTQSFCSPFITCSRVPQPLDSLLSMSMREGESIKAYSERY